MEKKEIKFKQGTKHRGVLPEKLGGVCGTPPETLTLFQTKICAFPYPISDLIKKWIKNHNLWLGTYLYSLYKRLRDPPTP